MPKSALIIVDVQNDFCEGGNLAVPDGSAVVPIINKIRTAHPWDLIVLTQDWHPAGHISFATTHKKEPFSTTKLDYGDQTMWPDHCVQGSSGAEFHKDLVRADSDAVVRKGHNPKVDSYSGFQENDQKTKTELEELLKKQGITHVFTVGLAYDYCVSWTAMDAVSAGFDATMVTDASRGIAPATVEAADKAMKEKGVHFVTAADIKLPA